MNNKLQNQSILCFTFFSNLDYHSLNSDDIFILDGTNTDTESMSHCFTYFTKEVVETEKVTAIINGRYTPNDFKDDATSITICHEVTCINDVSQVIRYWLNKYYPRYAIKPLQLYYMGEVLFI